MIIKVCICFLLRYWSIRLRLKYMYMWCSKADTHEHDERRPLRSRVQIGNIQDGKPNKSHDKNSPCVVFQLRPPTNIFLKLKYIVFYKEPQCNRVILQRVAHNSPERSSTNIKRLTQMFSTQQLRFKISNKANRCLCMHNT